MKALELKEECKNLELFAFFITDFGVLKVDFEPPNSIKQNDNNRNYTKKVNSCLNKMCIKNVFNFCEENPILKVYFYTLLVQSRVGNP